MKNRFKEEICKVTQLELICTGIRYYQNEVDDLSSHLGESEQLDIMLRRQIELYEHKLESCKTLYKIESGIEYEAECGE